MKRIMLIIGCSLMIAVSVNAQTLEQKKICALKWTLQQAFYNKSEGQQIAHLDVTEFKSFSEFQKNKLVSDVLKKITDTTEQNRVKRIINATSASDVDASVPSGANKEYKADVDKIKSQTVTEEEASENEEQEKTEEPSAPEQTSSTPEIKTVEEAKTEQTAGNNETVVENNDEPSNSSSGMSFLEVLLTSFGLYIVLSVCALIFIRSRRSTKRAEETVSMEQYRSERVRLIERIKAVEIEIDNLKSAKKEQREAGKQIKGAETQQTAVQTPATSKIEPSSAKTHESKKSNSQSLFDEPVKEEKDTPEAVTPQVEKPAVRPKNYSAVMFYPVPIDGVFVNGSTEIEVGTSFYMLKTNDDLTATFQILNTPEAINSALVSMDEMVKPACKILNTVASPVEILAEKLGTAEKFGDGWKITNKAVVRLI